MLRSPGGPARSGVDRFGRALLTAAAAFFGVLAMACLGVEGSAQLLVVPMAALAFTCATLAAFFERVRDLRFRSFWLRMDPAKRSEEPAKTEQSKSA